MAAPTDSAEAPAASRAAPTASAALWDNRRMATHSKFLSLALMCIVGIAGVAASALWRHRAPAVDLTTGTLITTSRELPDFSLIDEHDRPFRSTDLRGHWSMLFFGYTNCPDLCPTTLAVLAS